MPHLLRPGLLALLSACSATGKPCPAGASRQDDGLCYLDATGGDTADRAPAADTAAPDDPAPEGRDPIRTTGSTEAFAGDYLYEFVDVAMINDELAIAVGQGGIAVIAAEDGRIVAQQSERRGLRVATDGQLAAIATRTEGLPLVDLHDPAAPRRLDPLRFDGIPGAHEDVAVDDGRILLGFHDNGALLVDAEGRRLATIPADDAFAVALQGDRALVTDGASLGLWDLSALDSPALLDRIDLPAEGRDLAWSGRHVAVGMGGAGTWVGALDDTQLSARATLRSPGSALSVSIDEDRLWIGAWEVTALADLAAEPPVVVGHETPVWSAMAVAGAQGRAVVADWYAATALAAVDGARGPELVPPLDLYFDPRAPRVAAATFENGGTEPLSVSLSVDGDAFSVSPTELTIPPHSAQAVVITPEADWSGARADLSWTTDDADEPTGSTALAPADQGVGSQHVDAVLQGFRLPDRSLQSFDLADARGKIVVLVYWALF